MAVIQESFTGEVLIMTALADTNVLDVVQFPDSIGIAQTAGLAGELISVKVVGVFEIDADTATDFAVGDLLGYDFSAGTIVANVDANSDGYAGICWSTKAGSVAGTVQVKIG